MKTLLIAFFLFSTFFNPLPSKKEFVTPLENCTYKSKKLYGKIQLVQYAGEADVKVKIVSSFPNLKVQFVENNATTCGKWQIVDTNADLKVYITESFPDFTIQPTANFPGLPQ